MLVRPKCVIYTFNNISRRYYTRPVNQTVRLLNVESLFFASGCVAKLTLNLAKLWLCGGEDTGKTAVLYIHWGIDTAWDNRYMKVHPK